MPVIWYILFAVSFPLLSSSKECHLPCNTGDQCVERSEWCNGQSDCHDKSDEAYCQKAGWFRTDPNNCLENTHILCESGICLPQAAKCDGYKDCEDGFDEKYCDTITTKSSSSIETSSYEDFSKEKTANTENFYSDYELPTFAIPKHFKDHASTTDVLPNKINGHQSTSTSYYEKRLKETAIRPLMTTVPTYIETPSTTKTYLRNGRPHIAAENRSRIFANAPRSRSDPQQIYGQIFNQQQNPINHYLLLNNEFNQKADHYPANRYQPHINSHQILTNHYQSHDNRYRARSDQSRPNNQPHVNQYQRNQSSYRQSSYNDPLNGKPDHSIYTNHLKAYSSDKNVKEPFYFNKNYAELYGRGNSRSIRQGVEWLLRQRTISGDWGRDTPRAIIALSLANNSFLNGESDHETLKRRFMIQLSADLLRDNSKNVNVNRLSMAINGLLAVCEDPTDYHGMDLTEVLKFKISEDNKKKYQSPFVYLSLCLCNKSLSSSDIQSLMKQMAPSIKQNERSKDMLSAAILALSCHQTTSGDSSLRSTLHNAVAHLLQYFAADDGSFGSVYSTALAAQALMSTNESSNWNAAKTLDFLKQQQREDGSFDNLLTTYFTLPALSGLSLLHLRSIQCNPIERELTPSEIVSFAGPKQSVHVSLYFGYPVVNSQSLYLVVPERIHFLDVMRVAEFQDQNFRFAFENNLYKVVYSLSGVPNDPELGMSWHLYVEPHQPHSREKFTGDVRSLFPKPNEHFIFWYHSNQLQM